MEKEVGGQYCKYMVLSPTDGCFAPNQYAQRNCTFLVALSARQKVNSNVMLVKKMAIIKKLWLSKLYSLQTLFVKVFSDVARQT